MPLTYIDGSSPDRRKGPFATNPLSDITDMILEPIEPREALPQCLRLSYLLLLSNQLSSANTLLHAMFTNFPAITTPSYHNNAFTPEHGITFPSSLDNFWLSHVGLHQRPSTARVREVKDLRKKQWDQFRDCTFTGWMREHCSVTEPSDVQLWRETDEPKMLAMCCRLLAKTKEPLTYVSEERMREALEVARKLYALPQVCVTEWVHDGTQESTYSRHNQLVYRRLAIELAIRTGQLDVAAEVLGMALRIDGLCYNGNLDDFLVIDGIWDVLPLLAERGVEGNPFFIEDGRAKEIVGVVVGALELRAREGRQWSLSPEKLGWKELLDRLAQGAWKVNRKEYRSMGINSAAAILHPPASEEKIAQAEEEVGELPADFKEMVRIADGFTGGWHFLSGGITGIQNICTADDYELEHCENDFHPHKIDPEAEHAGAVIEIGTMEDCDGFRHYIIPHRMWKDIVVEEEVKEGEYRYTFGAGWQCGNGSDESVWDFIAGYVEMVEAMVARGEKVTTGGVVEEDSEDEDEIDVDGGERKKAVELIITSVNDGEINGKKRKAEEDRKDDWVKVDNDT